MKNKYESSLDFIDSLENKILKNRKSATEILSSAMLEYYFIQDEDKLGEALKDSINLKDSIINDTLTISEVTLYQLKETLKDIDNCIAKYQDAIPEFYDQLNSIEALTGKSSEYHKLLSIITNLENELTSMNIDRDNIIYIIKKTENRINNF